MQSQSEDLDLESQREKLLAKLKELVSPHLQNRIAEAISIAAQLREVAVKTSHSGAADADAE